MKTSIRALFGFCLLASSLASADQLKELVSDEAALIGRYQLIKAAKKEILVQYFEVGRDETAMKGLALLQEAAKRGVKVKLIVDNMHNELKTQDMAALKQIQEDPSIAKNFEIKVFNPVSNLKLFNQTYRDHSKRMIVDGEAMIIGGRNGAGGYFGQNKKASDNFRDFEVMTRGKGAQACAKDFKDLWDKNPMMKVPDLRRHSLESNLAAECTQCEKAKRAAALKEIFKSQKEFDGFLASVHEQTKNKENYTLDRIFEGGKDVDVQCVSNDPAKTMKKVDFTLADQLFDYLNKNANDSITIVTPYLFPTDRALQMMRKLIKEKGIKVKIVTNSLASTDMTIVHSGYSKIKKQLAEMGAEVYEYAGPEVLHAKMLIMDENKDNATTMTGSFNFDQRSALINREIGVIITGKDQKSVAHRASTAVDSIIKNSVLSVSGGKMVNQDKLEQLMNQLPEEVAQKKREDVKKYEALVKLMPKQI